MVRNSPEDKKNKSRIEEKCQMACKPGSVPPPFRGHRWSFLWDGCCQPPQATNPNGDAETHLAQRPAVPIRSCFRWGLPCRSCYQARGALLPHPFTLTCEKRWRFAFCGTVPGVAPAGRYPAPCFSKARTFLPAREAGRPSGHLAGGGVGSIRALVKLKHEPVGRIHSAGVHQAGEKSGPEMTLKGENRGIGIGNVIADPGELAERFDRPG